MISRCSASSISGPHRDRDRGVRYGVGATMTLVKQTVRSNDRVDLAVFCFSVERFLPFYAAESAIGAMNRKTAGTML